MVRISVAKGRNYAVPDANEAKNISLAFLHEYQLADAVWLGSPEIDDRYHVWRVPLLCHGVVGAIGEIVINAYTAIVLTQKSTTPQRLQSRLLDYGRGSIPSAVATAPPEEQKHQSNAPSVLSSDEQNSILLGQSAEVLQGLPEGCVDLVFTSPPYYNARPEYAEYASYQEYLGELRKVFRATHRVLAEGRFCVVNVAPILIRRTRRSEASKRIALPFDVHQILVEEGYEFIDDIIWLKPSGSGWATGRGRRFAADRNPLQYKAVPVTEYVLVYRKKTARLIDWNIRAHPNQALVTASRIGDDYERTNVWRISPARDKRHPAVFPLELCEKVITYYSFKGDVILDPYAGIGTVGKAAAKLGRQFILIDRDPTYVDIMQTEAVRWSNAPHEEGDTNDVSVNPNE